MSPADLVALIERHRYTVTCERELQEAIGLVLTREGVSFSSEVRLSPRDRPDFMVGSTALEAKVASWSGQVLRQVTRYMQHEAVLAVVLVTTLRRHSLPAMVLGKPVLVALARGL